MKLLDIAQSYLSDDPTDIAGVFIHRQFQVLKRKGWDIKVVNPQALFYRELKGRGRYYPMQSDRDGIPIWRPRYFWFPKWLNSDGFIYETAYKRAVLRSLKQFRDHWKPDLIVGDWIVPGGFAAAEVATKWKTPLVLRARGHDVEVMIRTSRQSNRRRAHYCSIIDRATWVVCQGQGLYRELQESELYDAKKLVCLTNGLDTDLFHPASAGERSAARLAVGLPEKAVVALFVGRWEKSKGSRELTQALKAALTRFPDVHFVSIGPVLDRPSRLELEQCFSRARFLGPVEPRKVNSFYHASDIFVLPSYREGLPNALLEALACGLLAIVTPVGGIPSIVRDKMNGIIVQPRDPASLEMALIDCLYDFERTQALRTAARQTIPDMRLDLVSVASQVHELFENCVNGRTRM